MILMDHVGTYWPRPDIRAYGSFQKGDTLTYNLQERKFEARHGETESLLFENNDDAIFHTNTRSEIKQIIRLMASACGLKAEPMCDDNTKIEVKFV